MATTDKVSIELEVKIAQEVNYTISTMIGKLNWVLENKSPRNPDQIEDRIKLLEKALKQFNTVLNERAKAVQQLKLVK